MNKNLLNNVTATLDGLDIAAPEQDMGRPSLAARLQARLLASRLDREIEAGAVVVPGTPLAAHVARLTSVEQRHCLARGLRRAVDRAESTRRRVSGPFPIGSGQVAECRSEIDHITLLLHSPRPVHPRGMARLRMLLTDGTGPLYDGGSGNLAAELRAVVAAL
jgi:hypothetical protein